MQISPKDLLLKANNGACLDSNLILQQLIYRCQAIIRRTNRVARSADTALLLKNSSMMRDSDWAFVCRSPSIRIAIESLLPAFEQDKDFFLTEIDFLNSRFGSIVGLYDRKGEFSSWQEAISSVGFDFKKPLSTPYPFVATLWGGELESTEGWKESRETEKRFNRAKRSIINSNSGDSQFDLKLVAMSETVENAFFRGLETLKNVSALLVKDVCYNVRYVSAFEHVSDSSNKYLPSSYTVNLFPGACFVSPKFCTTDEYVAETLYHEALHLKYFYTVSGFGLHYQDYVGEVSTRFTCPWIDSLDYEAKHWPFERAFAAFHVYMHLILYYRLALENVVPGSEFESHCSQRLAMCYDKAGSLFEWVERNWEGVFTAYGQQFYGKLREVYLESLP